MAFMGFAGTLGAEWCDYLLADDTAVPPDTLRQWRRNIDLEDALVDDNSGGDDENWITSLYKSFVWVAKDLREGGVLGEVSITP